MPRLGTGAKFGNHSSAYLPGATHILPNRASAEKLAQILETDLSDLCGISELQAKETKPEETHRSSSAAGIHPLGHTSFGIQSLPWKTSIRTLLISCSGITKGGWGGRRKKKGVFHLFLGFLKVFKIFLFGLFREFF